MKKTTPSQRKASASWNERAKKLGLKRVSVNRWVMPGDHKEATRRACTLLDDYRPTEEQLDSLRKGK